MLQPIQNQCTIPAVKSTVAFVVGFLVVFASTTSTVIAQPPFPQPPSFLPKAGNSDGADADGDSEPAALLPNVAQLIKSLTGGSESERLVAIEKLSELGLQAAGAVDALTKSVDDDSDHVRMATLYALGMTGKGAEDARKQVRQRMESGRSEFERILAAWAYVRMADDEQEVSKAIPTLVSGLKSDNQRVAIQAANALEAVGLPSSEALISLLDDQSAQVRSSAAEVLGRIGAREAVPQLAELLKDKDALVQANSARALGQIGPAAASSAAELASLLESENPRVRASSAEALGSIAPTDREAIKQLARTTNDASPIVAKQAVRSLGRLNLDSEAVVRVMASVVRTGKPPAADEAMQVLANIGKPAVPTLLSALKEQSSQYWATIVLSDIEGEDEAISAALAEALESASPDTQIEMCLALGKRGKKAAGSVDKITPLLTHKHNGVRYAATYAVASIGMNNEEVEKAVVANANSEDKMLAMVSTWARAKLNPENPFHGVRAAKALGEALASDDPQVKQAATLALAELDLNPAFLPTMLPKLTEVFQSDDVSMRDNAAQALADIVEKSGAVTLVQGALSNDKTRAMAVQVAEKLGPVAAPVVPQLAAALGSDSDTLRRDAAMALASVGESAADATPQLTARLSDGAFEVQWAAAYALGSVGPKAIASAEALAKLSSDGPESIRGIAAWALANVAPNHSLTKSIGVATLVKSLSSEDVEERIRAANGLELVGGNATAAVEALKYAQQDPNSVVRTAAGNALKAIVE